MEFWGAEVKPGKPLMVTPDEDNIIHISQASDDEDDSEKGMEEVDEDDSDDDEESEEEEETPKKPEPINKKMPNESASKTSVSGKKAKQAAAPAATPQKTGSKSKVGDGGKYHGSNDLCRSILSEKLLQLLPYRPALHPTWKGRIVDSATPSEFNGEFLAQPASKVSRKAYRLSKAIPVSLKVKLVPIGNLLNDLFVNRNPGLSDVELYILPYDENTKRFTEERDHLFEAMRTRNAMIKIDINGTPLLLFSSKLLDKSSQIIMKMQKKTNNFLWGIFLLKEAQHFDGDVIDNDTEV